MDEYLLPVHVHCCQRGDAFVFLDLERDDYTLIPGDAAAALKTLASQPAQLSETQAHALRELVAAGLLTTQAGQGRPFVVTPNSIALESLLEREQGDEIGISAVHLWNFVAACTVAATSLKTRSIASTVAKVARRKARRNARDVDMERARRLTALFLRLRALFPFNYLCLFDSLALIEFLARYDIYPNWVFGVRLEPWAAHCWVQQGAIALNEEIERAAHYTQIMAI